MNLHEHGELHVPPKNGAGMPSKYCGCFSRLPRLSGYDFLTDGPPVWTCALCKQGFQEWEVSDTDWMLIPEEHRGAHLCLLDYRGLVKDAGHDPEKIEVAADYWKGRMEDWQATKNESPDRVHLRLPDVKQIVWCKPVAERSEGHLVVSLQSQRMGLAPAPGTLFRASWDGKTISGSTGRPVLEPVRRLQDMGNAKGKRGLRLPWLNGTVPVSVN